MRSPKNNEKDLLKCLHELSYTVGQLTYFLEKGEHKADVINRIKANLAAVNERLGRLDVRIGRS